MWKGWPAWNIDAGDSLREVVVQDLRAILTGLGYTDVATLLQSGHAVFTSERRGPDKQKAAWGEKLAEMKQLGIEYHADWAAKAK